MTTLHVLTGDYLRAADALADLDMPAEAVADTLESLAGEFEEKAQRVAYMIQNFRATSAAIKEHAKAQLARAAAIDGREEALTAYLANCMQAAEIEKISGPGVALSFRKSTAVIISDPALVPAEFMRTPQPPPPSPDKTAIAAALKAGQDVQGAALEHRKSLQIK